MIRLRALEPSDVDRLYLWENNPEMWRYGFSPAPLSRHQIWEYVQNYDANPLAQRQLRLMIEEVGSELVVGTVDLYDIDVRNGRAFVGVMVADEFRRQGFAGQAIDLLAEYCRNNLGLRQLVAVVAADNIASVTLFRRCAFEQLAKLDQWVARGNCGEFVDALVFRLLL